MVSKQSEYFTFIKSFADTDASYKDFVNDPSPTNEVRSTFEGLDFIRMLPTLHSSICQQTGRLRQP
jgi:hypothetical protein